VRSVETVLALVVLATVVAAFANRLRVPAPSLLVVAGLVVGLLPGVPPVRVTPGVVSLVVLPPLLYAASEELPWRDVRDVWRPVTLLAVGLVLASAAAVALVAAALTTLTASMAFVLGAVLASTDPVAVTALGRRLSLPSRVQALVQAESLFNDATSLVLFRIAVSLAVTGAAAGTSAGTRWLHGLGQFAVLAGGGALAGAVIAAGIAIIRRRITDPVLETVVALVTPYAAYVLAEAAGVSGVTAVIVAGLILGAQLPRVSTPQTRLQLHSVYQTVIFLLESVVFSLIGLELPTLIRALSADGRRWPLAALAVAGTLIATRVLWVFPLSAVIQWRRGAGRLTWQVPAVVSWAGTRGVVPLAAALSIPLTTAATPASPTTVPLPGRDLVLVLAAAVIAISLTVQGLTLEPLVRLAGLSRPAADTRHEETVARLRLAEAGLARLEELAVAEAAPDAVIDHLRRGLEARISATRARMQDHPDLGLTGAADRDIRRELIAVENAELKRLYENGIISDVTRRRLQRSLDLEATGLGDDHH